MIEEEIRIGTQRRRNKQKELAMNYLTTLGKDHSPPQPRETPKISQNGQSSPTDGEFGARCESPMLPDEIYDHGRGKNGYVDGIVKSSPDFHHTRGAFSLGVLPAGRGIQYYD